MELKEKQSSCSHTDYPHCLTLCRLSSSFSLLFPCGSPPQTWGKSHFDDNAWFVPLVCLRADDVCSADSWWIRSRLCSQVSMWAQLTRSWMPLALPRPRSFRKAVSHTPGRAGPELPALGGRHPCPNLFLIFLSAQGQALRRLSMPSPGGRSERGCPLLTSHTQGWHCSNPRSLESAQQWRLHSPPPQAGPWSSPASPDPSYKVSVKGGERFLLPC